MQNHPRYFKMLHVNLFGVLGQAEELGHLDLRGNSQTENRNKKNN